MRTLFAFIFALIVIRSEGALPPIVRNQFTTNSSPPILLSGTNVAIAGAVTADSASLSNGLRVVRTDFSTNSLRRWNPIALPCRLVVEGDSHSVTMMSNQVNWSDNFFTNYAQVWGWTLGTNAAAAGDTVTNMVTTYTAQIHPFAPSGGTNAVFICFAGVNDLTSASITTALAFNNYSNLISLAKADGFFVVGGTLPDSSVLQGPTIRAKFRHFNLLARVYASMFDRFIDVEMVFNQPTALSYPIAETSATVDGIHATSAQGFLLGEAIASALILPVRTYLPMVSSYRQFDVLELNGSQITDAGFVYNARFSGQYPGLSLWDTTLNNHALINLHDGSLRMAYTNAQANYVATTSEFLQATNSSTGPIIRLNWPIVATKGITSTLSNLLASTAITFPATTVNWTNPLPVSIMLYIDNSAVTGTAVKKNGTQIFGGLSADVTIGLQVGEYFSETYSVGTPTGTYHPFP